MKEQQEQCKIGLANQDYRKFLQYFKTMPCSEMGHTPEYCVCFHLQTSIQKLGQKSAQNQQSAEGGFISHDRRRSPYGKLNQILYYPEYCQKLVSGCQNQECGYCHNSWEFNYHPLVFKTSNCQHFYDCSYKFCFKIHYSQYVNHPKTQVSQLRFSQFFRFDILTFKSVLCKKQYTHDKNSCLCYHNAKDYRRPNFQCYDHMQCKKIGEGGCYDQNCQFSHNKIQQLYHPSRYKSKFCEKHELSRKNANDQTPTRSLCPYGKYCSFAHDQSQISVQLIDKLQKNLQFHLYAYKTVWCPYTTDHNRSVCVYAHNIQDFRRNPKQYHYQPIQCQFWKKNENIKSIQEAGCPQGMNCNKCHGWKEKQYHPIIYCNKGNQPGQKNRQKSDKKSDSYTSSQRQKNESPYVHSKKNSDMILKKLGAQFNAKSNLQSIVQTLYNKSNPQKNLYKPGAPFFKNTNHGKIKSQSERGDKQENEQKLSKQQQKCGSIMTTKSIAIKADLNDFQDIDDTLIFKAFESGNERTCDEKRSAIYNRTQKNQSDNGKQHKLQKVPRTVSKSLGFNSRQNNKSYYSKDISQLLNPQIISVLKGKNISQIKLINMNQEQIRKIEDLTNSQKSLIIKKIATVRDNSKKNIDYQGILHKYFIKYGRQDILAKMKSKNVKQEKLLLLDSSIKELSFLSQSQKCILPKIIAEFKDNKQFEQLNLDISKSIASDGCFGRG